ncbi:ribonuclease H-like domain-containing protein, partial [Cristinia sonorae]
QIGTITLDNASNNNTLMRELQRLLKKEDIPFDAEGNRIRYRTGKTDPLYAAALKRDPISLTRKLVKVLRSSWGRRQGLRDTIADGNRRQFFRDGKEIKHQELLRDVDTRWSSLFLMINRLIELYEAIDTYLNKAEQRSIRNHALSDMELRVLLDIRQLLHVFHLMQELLSAEKTPTLAMTIPIYEQLLRILRYLARTTLKPLAHAINASIARIEKYMAKAKSTRVYSLSMVVHPHFRFDWIQKYWGDEAAADARRWTRELVSNITYQYSYTCSLTS